MKSWSRGDRIQSIVKELKRRHIKPHPSCDRQLISGQYSSIHPIGDLETSKQVKVTIWCEWIVVRIFMPSTCPADIFLTLAKSRMYRCVLAHSPIIYSAAAFPDDGSSTGTASTGGPSAPPPPLFFALLLALLFLLNAPLVRPSNLKYRTYTYATATNTATPSTTPKTMPTISAGV